MYANTTAHEYTHFIRAVELIDHARHHYHVCSENWPYPMRHRLGDPRGRYYAEVWVDGMDWQPSYWLVEMDNYSNPKCMPLVIFEDHKYRDLFNQYDFSNLLYALMQYRQDLMWVKHGENGYHNEEIWPYFKVAQPVEYMKTTPGMFKAIYEHGSQKAVPFFVNEECVPGENRPQI